MTIEERNRTLDFSPPPWPEDFPRRLERLKKLAGVSWKRMAERLGVTDRGALKWRRGGRPSAGNFLAILELAREVPGGYDLMMYGDEGTESADGER